MPTPYSEMLSIAPADRWNVRQAMQCVPLPGGVVLEYQRRRSTFVISSAAGRAMAVQRARRDVWLWLLNHRR